MLLSPAHPLLRASQFHSRETFASFQQHVLLSLIPRRRIRRASPHVIKVFARHLRARVLADGKPCLGLVSLLQIVRSARSTHFRGDPSGLESVGKRCSNTEAIKFFVVVFPFEPVTATMLPFRKR